MEFGVHAAECVRNIHAPYLLARADVKHGECTGTPAQQFQSAATQNNADYMPAKKFCRSCGAQVMNTDNVCSKCGVKVGEGSSFCPHCAAPINNPQQVVCTSCGMSLKNTFDVTSYLKQFADNFTKIFKDNDVLTLILDWGSYLASFLIFILSVLPTCYVSATVFGVTASENFNTWYSPLGGFLFLLAFLVSIARFVPHVDEFIKKNEVINKFCIFVVPGLSVIALWFCCFKRICICKRRLYILGNSPYSLCTCICSCSCSFFPQKAG